MIQSGLILVKALIHPSALDGKTTAYEDMCLATRRTPQSSYPSKAPPSQSSTVQVQLLMAKKMITYSVAAAVAMEGNIYGSRSAIVRLLPTHTISQA